MWKVGVAFIRGINMFGNRRIAKKDMLKLLVGVEDENLRILDVFRVDNVIFKKRGIHFAEVSRRIENVLSEHFGDRVYVTSRSAATVNGIAQRVQLLSGHEKEI